MSSSLPESGFIKESSSIGCLQYTPPPPLAVQSEAAAARQSCQCDAALRNRAEPPAFILPPRLRKLPRWIWRQMEKK
ncbi:hypothetical protein PBY51_014036 [Eleginops maclovinus]|uniref:Uncharacterized protein n=1 Tax=Eleginops maclovinus TaxID=56733 RepID=A0AAN7WUH9_ELEMC|nr:hypothetical protein PBY51_014036 [Eleginops maclovinus]